MPRLSDRIEGLHQELTDVLMAARTAHVEPILGEAGDTTPLDRDALVRRFERIYKHAEFVDTALDTALARLAGADLGP